MEKRNDETTRWLGDKMSEPTVQTPASAIDRANRLLSLRANPGFADARRISKDMADEAGRISITYPGWDPQQIMVLKARAQAALEHHELFFSKIQEAIREGVQAQANHATLSEKTPTEILEQGDYVRQEVLAHFSDLDSETRSPGSY
jgi:hypothetical protein